MPRPSKLYLLAYNSLQFLGWSLALSRILTSLVATNSVTNAFTSAGDLICNHSPTHFIHLHPTQISFSSCIFSCKALLQTFAFMGVIHAAVGLVPSGAVLTLMQWGGRTHFLLAIVRRIAEVQTLRSVFITFLSWSLSEVIRYSHYAWSCIGVCPSWLTYLRYTAFILLYPIGLFPGEMLLMYQALPFIKERNLYSNFFDRLPLSYYNFVVALLVCYPFLWFQLYMHLLKQRRSKLGKHQTKKKV